MPRPADDDAPVTYAGLGLCFCYACFVSARFAADVLLFPLLPVLLPPLQCATSLSMKLLRQAGKAVIPLMGTARWTLSRVLSTWKALRSYQKLHVLTLLVYHSGVLLTDTIMDLIKSPRTLVWVLLPTLAPLLAHTLVRSAVPLAHRNVLIPLPRGPYVLSKGLLWGQLYLPYARCLRNLSGRETNPAHLYAMQRRRPDLVPRPLWYGVVLLVLLHRRWLHLPAVAARPRPALRATMAVLPPRPSCRSYAGFPLECSELERARSFNREVMPSLSNAGYRKVRKLMTEYGLSGFIWHVGHACPDPSKASTMDTEDRGWNLFAQHAVDNGKLSGCLVSCSEARHAGAVHVPCTEAVHGCQRNCTGARAGLMA